MRQYLLERRLSHADVDFLGELKMSALLGLFEQAAVEASADLGYDPVWYAREGRVWFVRRTQVDRFMPVGGADTIEVETGVTDFRRARSLRRYIVRRNGTVVAEGTTDWVYCDVTMLRPVRIPDAMQRAFSDNEALPMLPRPDPLPVAGVGSHVEFPLRVQPSHLDHIMHVNNAVYAGYLEDAAFELFAAHGWPLPRMLEAGGALRMRNLDAEYLTDATWAEKLVVRSWFGHGATEVSASATTPPETAALVQDIRRHDGTTLLRTVSTWGWRRRPTVLGGVPT